MSQWRFYQREKDGLWTWAVEDESGNQQLTAGKGFPTKHAAERHLLRLFRKQGPNAIQPGAIALGQ